MDFTTSRGVLDYLEKTPFVATSATLLLGGVTNYTYRIQLAKEYNGRKTVVLKHAESYAALVQDISLDAERIVRRFVLFWVIKKLIWFVPRTLKPSRLLVSVHLSHKMHWSLYLAFFSTTRIRIP